VLIRTVQEGLFRMGYGGCGGSWGLLDHIHYWCIGSCVIVPGFGV